MTDTLVIPRPKGNVAEMEYAASSLDKLARSVHHAASDLDHLGREVGANWTGVAATEFDRGQRLAHMAVMSIAENQHQSAQIIRNYSQQWEAKNKLAEQAHRDATAAVNAYVSDSKSLMSNAAADLKNFINSNPVTDFLIDLLPGAEALLTEVAKWSPPSTRPSMEDVSVCQMPTDVSGQIANTIKNTVEWGLSAVFKGVDFIVDAIGGLIRGALDMARKIEAALINALNAAQRIARSAINKLFEFAKKAAVKIIQVVTDAAKAAWNFVVQVWEATVAIAKAVAQAIGEVLAWVVALGLAIVGLRAAIHKAIIGFGFNLYNTLSNQNRRVRDHAAIDKALYDQMRSPEYLQRVKDMAALASASYGDGKSGVPVGWTLVAIENGPTDGVAYVYENNESKERVVAFRGSQKTGHWLNNAASAGGLPTFQGAWAIEMAKKYPNATYTGHSLGGSLASIASMTSGGEAITFNAAGVSDSNLALVSLAGGKGLSETQISNFYTHNDILTSMQELAPVGQPAAAGAHMMLHSPTDNMVDAHQMDAVMTSLNEI